MIHLTKMNVVIRDRGILQPRHCCLCFITQGAWSSPVLQALSIPALPFCQVNLCCHDVSFWKCFGSVRLVRLFVFFQPPPSPLQKAEETSNKRTTPNWSKTKKHNDQWSLCFKLKNSLCHCLCLGKCFHTFVAPSGSSSPRSWPFSPYAFWSSEIVNITLKWRYTCATNRDRCLLFNIELSGLRSQYYTNTYHELCWLM